MRTYSEEEINELIRCDKVVSEPPKKAMVSRFGHRRNDMRLRSKEGELDFTIFMRINDAFPENFSIGLVHSPKDERGTIILLRFNGPHGGFGSRVSRAASIAIIWVPTSDEHQPPARRASSGFSQYLYLPKEKMLV